MTPPHSDELQEGLDLKRLRADMATRLAIAVVMLFLLLTLIGTAFLAFQARDQARTNGQLSAEVIKTQDLLLDCTTPPGECYREGQKRTAEAVQGINQGTLLVVAAALECEARGLTDSRRIARCAERVVRSASGE